MLPIYNTMRGCSNSLCQGKCNKFSFFFSAQKVLSNHVEVKFHSWFFKIHNNFLTSVWTQQTNNNCHILHGDGNGLSLGEPGAASLAGQGPFVHHSQAMGQVLHWLHNIQNQAGGQKPKWVLGLYTARPYNIRLYEWRRAVQPISSSGTLKRKIFFFLQVFHFYSDEKWNYLQWIQVNRFSDLHFIQIHGISTLATSYCIVWDLI